MGRKPQQPHIRRAFRLESVLEILRMRIVQGELPPGSRFPTQDDLMKALGIGKATAQRLFDILTHDGFIVPQGANGTFVASDPPHLSRFGLVFPFDEQALVRSRFYLGLLSESRLFAERGHGEFTMYYQAYTEGSREYLRLLDDMQHHRLAGVIFATDVGPLFGTQIMALRDIPRVAITYDTNALAPEIPAVFPDLQGFMAKAVEHLAQVGRRRIAHIASPVSKPLHDAFRAEVEQHALLTQLYWQLQINLSEPSAARNIAHCLMRLPIEDRPDGLIISDDNLVEETVAGLIDAGVRVPADLAVVAHVNFPLCPTSPLPVHWLGFDLQEVLSQCMAIIRQERHGIDPPPISFIPAGNFADYTATRRRATGQRAKLPTASSAIRKRATT